MARIALPEREAEVAWRKISSFAFTADGLAPSEPGYSLSRTILILIFKICSDSRKTPEDLVTINRSRRPFSFTLLRTCVPIHVENCRIHRPVSMHASGIILGQRARSACLSSFKKVGAVSTVARCSSCESLPAKTDAKLDYDY